MMRIRLKMATRAVCGQLARVVGKVGAAALLAVLLSWGVGHAATAQCPPVVPNAGVSASIVGTWSGGNPAACDIGFTVGTSSTIVQAPAVRHFLKITNVSGSGGPNLGVCFTRLELGTTCTIANAGTILTPGQSFYIGVGMYIGLSGPQLFNSMFLGAAIQVVGSNSGTGVAFSTE